MFSCVIHSLCNRLSVGHTDVKISSRPRGPPIALFCLELFSSSVFHRPGFGEFLFDLNHTIIKVSEFSRYN